MSARKTTDVENSAQLEAKKEPVVAGEAFIAAYTDYIQALTEAQKELRRRYEDLYTAYLTSVSGAQRAATARFGAITREYAAAVKRVSGMEDATTQVAEAGRKSMAELQESEALLQQESQEAFDTFRRDLPGLMANLEADNLRLCRSYLSAVKRAWAGVEVDAIDVQGLLMIAQTFSSAATYGSASLMSDM